MATTAFSVNKNDYSLITVGADSLIQNSSSYPIRLHFADGVVVVPVDTNAFKTLEAGEALQRVGTVPAGTHVYAVLSNDHYSTSTTGTLTVT